MIFLAKDESCDISSLECYILHQAFEESREEY
mgnify:CR=1 FL=1